ncbi:Pentatricopeptide repeat-containing protein [Nymphaea thermarum]|nr:Pentatricopeptide repeat-containing protein [Nymphaea thermarum]
MQQRIVGLKPAVEGRRNFTATSRVGSTTSTRTSRWQSGEGYTVVGHINQHAPSESTGTSRVSSGGVRPQMMLQKNGTRGHVDSSIINFRIRVKRDSESPEIAVERHTKANVGWRRKHDGGRDTTADAGQRRLSGKTSLVAAAAMNSGDAEEDAGTSTASGDDCVDVERRAVEKICKVAGKPLVVTYTGLIKACFDSGSIENGIYVYNHMTKFCFPNLVTYNMMLKAYVGHRMFSDAKGLFWKILEGAEVGSKVTGSGQKLTPDGITFNTMLEACAAEEKWDEFECVYQRMLHHGYQFDVKRHLRLILEASKAGKGHVVETAYSQLVQSGKIPPISIVKERFCYKLQQADCLGAIACVRDLAGYSVAFSKKVWLEFFKNNSQRFQRETLVRLVDSLVTEGDQAHQALESSCREFISSSMTIDSVVDVPI